MKPHHSSSRVRQTGYLGVLALAVMGLALMLPIAARPASAHGGGRPQLTHTRAGPYSISVWTDPDPVRVGEFHVTVAVTQPGDNRESGALVLDASVEVQVTPVDQVQETVSAFATRENAVNKLFYEADLELPGEGQWQVTIRVEGPAGAGDAGFAIQVLPPSAFSALLGFDWPVWAGGLGLVLLAAAWWVHMSRDPRGEVEHA